jgi:hypothetical protein
MKRFFRGVFLRTEPSELLLLVRICVGALTGQAEIRSLEPSYVALQFTGKKTNHEAQPAVPSFSG